MRLVCAVLVVACGGPRAAPTANHATAPPVEPGPTLVVLEPAAAECALRRIDPVGGAAIELARFPGACAGGRISWRPDLERALVWFDPGNLYSAGYGGAGVPAPGHRDEEAQITERRYEVDLATHRVSTIAPAPERAVEIAYGGDGSLYAFAERDLHDAKGIVPVEGRMLDFTQLQEGLPAAAITYRHDGGTWRLVDVAATTIGWDYARGWSAAPEAATIGPRSYDMLAAHAATTEIRDAATRGALDRIARSTSDGDGWAEIAGIYVWMISGEFVSTTGRIAWRGGAGAITLLPELGFTGGELVAIRPRGRFVLVASSNAGAFPRLYDLVARRLVYASETARAVTWWPEPRALHSP
ncbi:MAG TPA: hypothetical protein VLX92_10010 [Kofleriaceae bacterium]|nr:hypothetical protein [Kofleriaceae bacterium]